MEQISFWLSAGYIDVYSVAARLLLSLLACGLIGLERELRRQTAG